LDLVALSSLAPRKSSPSPAPASNLLPLLLLSGALNGGGSDFGNNDFGNNDFGNNDITYDQYGNPENPVKQAILLSGIASGSVSPLTAVAMDRNPAMTTTDSVVVSALGNNPLTSLLVLDKAPGQGLLDGGGLLGDNQGRYDYAPEQGGIFDDGQSYYNGYAPGQVILGGDQSYYNGYAPAPVLYGSDQGSYYTPAPVLFSGPAVQGSYGSYDNGYNNQYLGNGYNNQYYNNPYSNNGLSSGILPALVVASAAGGSGLGSLLALSALGGLGNNGPDSGYNGGVYNGGGFYNGGVYNYNGGNGYWGSSNNNLLSNVGNNLNNIFG